jgi:hypothetical protein
VVVIYIVLGILYESLVHPVTVLTTLPSAGVGAVLALLIFKMEFSTIALIGIFLLIGIVKKNAILIIDFALEAERSRGLTPREAVREACLLRFRPILMTTLAAALGALPLAIGFGEGSELRQPLGVAIIGGLIASQILTLLTTPVVYLLMDKLRRRSPSEQHLSRVHDAAPSTMSLHTTPLRFTSMALAVLAALLASGCAVTPVYQTASTPQPAAYKEAASTAEKTAAGWTEAAPADMLERGPWWQLFADPVLDQLAASIEVSNQNVAAAAANYAQARALVQQQRASLFPSVSLTASDTRSGGGDKTPTANQYRASIGASWEPDIWGKLGAGVDNAQASLQSAPPNWRQRDCRRKANWPPTTSRCARPMPRKRCWTPPWKAMRAFADHPKPLRCRAGRPFRSAAGGDPAGQCPYRPADAHAPARHTGTCDRRFAGQGCQRFHSASGRMESGGARCAGRRAIHTAAAPP